jgi:hypothetical protein
MVLHLDTNLSDVPRCRHIAVRLDSVLELEDFVNGRRDFTTGGELKQLLEHALGAHSDTSHNGAFVQGQHRDVWHVFLIRSGQEPDDGNLASHFDRLKTLCDSARAAVLDDKVDPNAVVQLHRFLAPRRSLLVVDGEVGAVQITGFL